MSKAVTKVIGILALSACLGSTAFASANTWTARGTSGEAAHIFAATTTGSSTTSSSSSTTMPAAAPEIDPAGALSGLSLLLGGLAIIRARRAK
jgi:hypothetical protein